MDAVLSLENVVIREDVVILGEFSFIVLGKGRVF
jgi:hypothetical protein